jgi:hypothetical protein|tara:strand:+ start:84 stop:884 length:801 start_codon:yes stop_codon:yes gene_type:complete
MFGRQFYHESLRKIVVAFGTIFNNIVIVRQDSDGGTIQRLKVPLAYSPKEKFLTRLEQQPNLDQREMAISLPRMGFEISGLSYDSSRKLQRVGKFKNVNTSDAGKQYYQYNPVPYNLSFNLYSFTATAEDGLCIVEQILPYFQPDYTVTINAIPSMGIKRDVPITLNSVDYQDTYDGSFTNRRAVNYTMNFTAKTYLYGPIYSSKVIKETQTDIYTDTTGSPKREERIVVVPNPTTADADDDFGFTTTISTYTDSKNYNPSTDSDA